MVIILNVGIVLIPSQSKVIYLYALPIICLCSFTCDILVKPVEPGQGAIICLSWEASFWDGIEWVLYEVPSYLAPTLLPFHEQRISGEEMHSLIALWLLMQLMANFI